MCIGVTLCVLQGNDLETGVKVWVSVWVVHGVRLPLSISCLSPLLGMGKAVSWRGQDEVHAHAVPVTKTEGRRGNTRDSMPDSAGNNNNRRLQRMTRINYS